jgi:hypothetical protein
MLVADKSMEVFDRLPGKALTIQDLAVALGQREPDIRMGF